MASVAAVVPTLASAELELACKRERERKRIGTSCSAIDAALEGGLDSGRMTCISGDRGLGKSTIALHLIATCLLTTSNDEVMVVDTTGNFDVVRLHQVLVLRTDTSSRTVNEADEVLNRLKIIRVFDFEGLVEAIDEIKQLLETHTVRLPSSNTSRKERMRQRGEIPDSDEDEDEIMIDSPSGHMAEACNSVNTMIVIDNLSSPVNALMKNNYIQAQALLTSFLRSLYSLTRTHNTTSIILNGIANPPKNTEHNQHLSTSRSANDVWISPSIFTANTFRPALGSSLGRYIDLHLMLSMLPKSQRDAKIMYAENQQIGARTTGSLLGSAETVHVLEVLTDRWSGRIGNWAAFRIDRGLELHGAL